MRVVRGTLFIGFDHEFGKSISKLPGSQEKRISSGTPTEFSLLFGKGLVEKHSAGCDERFDPREEGAVQVSKDQYSAKTCRFEGREWPRFEIGAQGFDRTGAASEIVEIDDVVTISIDCEDRESEVGCGEGMATASASQIERWADRGGGR